MREREREGGRDSNRTLFLAQVASSPLWTGPERGGGEGKRKIILEWIKVVDEGREGKQSEEAKRVSFTTAAFFSFRPLACFFPLLLARFCVLSALLQRNSLTEREASQLDRSLRERAAAAKRERREEQATGATSRSKADDGRRAEHNLRDGAAARRCCSRARRRRLGAFSSDCYSAAAAQARRRSEQERRRSE